MSRTCYTREQIGHILCAVLLAHYAPFATVAHCRDPAGWTASRSSELVVYHQGFCDAVRAVMTALDVEPEKLRRPAPSLPTDAGGAAR